MANLNAEFERACGAFDGRNFEALPERDKILVSIWGVEAEVNNGGFDQFFFNGAGDLAFYTPSALRMIGASRMADIVAEANAYFGDSGPPRDRDARQQRLFELTEGREDLFDSLDRSFQEYPDDVAALLEIYLDRQP